MALQTTLEHYNVLEYFPKEIIEIILCRYDDITTQDFVNFFSTCSHFYKMVNSKTFWQLHFYRRYFSF